VLAVGRRQEILGGSGNASCRKRSLDLHLAPLKELEEPFGVLLLLIRRLSKMWAI
jgi:hypothetical protein